MQGVCALQNYKLPAELSSILGVHPSLSLSAFCQHQSVNFKIAASADWREGVRLYVHIIVVGGAENASQSAANKGPGMHIVLAHWSRF